MGIKKTRLLAFKSIYWISTNAEIKAHVNDSTCLEFQQAQPKERLSTMKFYADHKKLFTQICSLYIKTTFVLQTITTSYQQLRIQKCLSADNLLITHSHFIEYGLLKEIMSDVGSSFIQKNSKNSVKDTEHSRSIIIIILPPPKQWTGGSMH